MIKNSYMALSSNVRTLPFHGKNAGSFPAGATKHKKILCIINNLFIFIL